MEKYFNWLRNHKMKSLCIAILIIILPILLMHIISLLFNIRFAHLSASDYLAYIGTVLAAIGTISLGHLALWQNMMQTSINKELQGHLKQIEINQTKPNLKLEQVEDIEIDDNKISIQFKLQNNGLGPAYKVNYHFSSPSEHIDIPLLVSKPSNIDLMVNDKMNLTLKARFKSNRADYEYKMKLAKVLPNIEFILHPFYTDINNEKYDKTKFEFSLRIKADNNHVIYFK